MPPADRAVLVVQHLEVEPLDRIAAALRDARVEMVTCPVHDGARPPASIAGFAGLVLMGGSMAAYSDLGFTTRRAELALCREAVASGVPTLGVCLGAQLLAEACGGRAFPGEAAEIGWVRIERTAAGGTDPLLGVLEPCFVALAWHGDTYDPPPGAVHLARSSAYEQQAFRLGARAWGLQFHLETVPATLETWVAAAEETGDLDAAAAAAIRAECAAGDDAIARHARTAFGAFAGVVAATGR